MPAPRKEAKGLETEEDLDAALAKHAEKRANTLLKQELKPTKPEKAKKEAPVDLVHGVQVDKCLECDANNCRLLHYLPTTFEDGCFDCKLCLTSGQATMGVWYCLDCQFTSHVSCFAYKKESLTRVPVPSHVHSDHPKPSLAWDPLALSGPHTAIGAGAGTRTMGEVALD
uniref:Uncharacterized protein n=1 Tax=Eutreptiella gymnastica TaxID=73025 RepID=A0A7S1NQP2_9EUGL